MRIYVTRHGQTEWNRNSIVCGESDIPLTEEGHLQAQALAHKLKGEPIHCIISSPMIRAVQTAQPIAQTLGLPFSTDERIVEQRFGQMEGIGRFDPEFQAAKRRFVYRYPDGESMMQLGQRVYNFLDELLEKHGDENVLIVCHGTICKIIRTYFQDMTNEEFWNFSAGNTDVQCYEI